MARVRAHGPIDMDRIDFGGFYASRFTASFMNNTVPMDNGEYWDGWEVMSGDRSVALGFLGPAVGYDYDTLSLTGGRFETVQVLDFTGYVPGEVEPQYRLRWLFEDFQVPALDLWRAVNTASVADDRALLRRALDGDDVLVLSPGADRAWGHDGADRLEGRGGRDRLEGGEGADRLLGGTGADQLDGGPGADLLTGGAGADTFVLRARRDSPAGGERDEVADFERGLDRLDLRGIDARPGDGDDALAWAGREARAHSAWWDRQGGDVVLRGDVTGDRRADFAVELSGLDRLGFSDLLL